jgi:hypothetical protein
MKFMMTLREEINSGSASYFSVYKLIVLSVFQNAEYQSVQNYFTVCFSVCV